MKYFVGLILSLFISIGFSQSDTNFYLNSIQLQYNFLGRTIRTVQLPNSVQQSPFYQSYFGNYGYPERIIQKKQPSHQLGANLGFRFDSYSTKNNHELIIGIGYQNSGEYLDKITRNNYPKDSSNLAENLAEIQINQQFREVYINGAWLFKTRGEFISFHTGFGLNFAMSNPEYFVTEFENDQLVNQYKVKEGFNTYTHFYIPIGFNIYGKSTNNEGFVFGLDYSLRFFRKAFSAVSFSIGYKY